MLDIRLVKAPLIIHFEKIDQNRDFFEKEFNSLSEFEEDAVGQWLKLAKAKGETENSDPVLLTLIVELHKKIDQLSALIKEEERTFISLSSKKSIDSIGFEHIKLEGGFFEEGEEYYCRIEMPVFPKREMPVFIRAISADIGKILFMHDKDLKDWNSYVTSRERIMIRELKAKAK